MNLPGGAGSHKQLHRVVSEHLRTAILDGTFKPGEWLRQNRIAEELGVSQMPVREALKELAAEGLVEHIPYRGVRVLKFSPEDVADLYAHRSVLEGMAARAAAKNITPEELDELHDLQRRMKENLAPDQVVEYRHLNRHFHQIIYTASRRDYLVRTLNQMWSAFPTMLWGNFPQTALDPPHARDLDDFREHDAIIAALESGDADQAEQLIQQHIDAAGKELVFALNSEQ